MIHGESRCDGEILKFVGTTTRLQYLCPLATFRALFSGLSSPVMASVCPYHGALFCIFLGFSRIFVDFLMYRLLNSRCMCK